MSTFTHRGLAIALRSALDEDELRELAERLDRAAAYLELASHDALETGQAKILARRADCLGKLAEAVEAEVRA